MQQDSVKLCPQCGSASVEFSALVGGRADCKGCRWHGNSEELLVVPIQHEFVNKEEILVTILNEARQLLAGEFGLAWLKFLIKWGFVQADPTNVAGTVDRKKFSRYMAAIGTTIISALITERARQVQEGTTNAPAS